MRPIFDPANVHRHGWKTGDVCREHEAHAARVFRHVELRTAIGVERWQGWHRRRRNDVALLLEKACKALENFFAAGERRIHERLLAFVVRRELVNRLAYENLHANLVSEILHDRVVPFLLAHQLRHCTAALVQDDRAVRPSCTVEVWNFNVYNIGAKLFEFVDGFLAYGLDATVIHVTKPWPVDANLEVRNIWCRQRTWDVSHVTSRCHVVQH
mmetsp:Transcript_2430/g.6587  ORF Transcript_2430/g.6587 Transcript_2430/m.6587 type:complete len:213 (+) Transcript_2430:132-770(+)